MTIENYLQKLAAKLRAGPRRKRRILREIEEHLFDAARREEAAGSNRAEAERRAIERFGSVESVAARFSELKAHRFRLAVVIASGVAAVVAATGLALSIGGEREAAPRHGVPVAVKVLNRVTHAFGSGSGTTVEIAIVDGYGDPVPNLRFLPHNKPFTYLVMDARGRTFVVPIRRHMHVSPAPFWLSG